MVCEAVENTALTGSKGRVTPQRVQIIANRAVQDAEARLEEKLQRKLVKATEDAASDAARRDKAAAEVLRGTATAEVITPKLDLKPSFRSDCLRRRRHTMPPLRSKPRPPSSWLKILTSRERTSSTRSTCSTAEWTSSRGRARCQRSPVQRCHHFSSASRWRHNRPRHLRVQPKTPSRAGLSAALLLTRWRNSLP